MYEPIETQPIPFPLGDDLAFVDVNSKSGGVFSQTEAKPQAFPSKKIAREIIGARLNTESKRILGQFQFTEQGALQIGKLIQGITGDIRISPVGIIGRDAAGNYTFTLDAETGDATFKGMVQAGSFIAGGGGARIEESSAGNGRIVLYNGDLPAILIGDPD